MVQSHRKTGQQDGQLRRAWRLSFLISLLFVGSLLVSCGNNTETALSSTPNQPADTNSLAPLAIKPEFAKLPGKWVRPDGGYVVEIKSIDSSGKMEAGYFNPGPIRVSRAAALNDHGEIKVFIELNDENYPGCTYSLKYDPQTDQLFGQYYQAAMGQTFDITFTRMKEGATE